MVNQGRRAWFNSYRPTKHMNSFWFILCVHMHKFHTSVLLGRVFFRSVHIVFLIMSNASHGLDLFFIISGTPKLRAVAISMICILTLDFFSGMVAAVSQRSPLALIILGFIRNSSSCNELYDYTFLGGKN